VSVKVGVAKCTISYSFYSIIKTVGVTVFGGLWALEWAWQGGTLLNQTCAAQEAQESASQISIAGFYSFRDLSVHTDKRTDGHG